MKKLSVNTDDELPDYIMVMVANRKTEEQMAEDLSLFLSNNTNKFTTWFVMQVLCQLFTLMISSSLVFVILPAKQAFKQNILFGP